MSMSSPKEKGIDEEGIHIKPGVWKKEKETENGNIQSGKVQEKGTVNIPEVKRGLWK